jgi:hypothetical protein
MLYYGIIGIEMIRINKFKVREYGKRGYEITLPAVWVKDLHLNIGDSIVVYRMSAGRDNNWSNRGSPNCKKETSWGWLRGQRRPVP